MKFILSSLLLIIALSSKSQALNSPGKEIHSAAGFECLPYGSIKPSGWIKIQMQQDMAGFVGNLDKLVPDLFNDPIYAGGRLHKQSKARDLGNLKSGDAGSDDQYKWWNSETQSNWWDGYIRNALVLDDTAAKEKVRAYIARVMASQDQDGYLGIYDTELRYKFSSENGELWSKATLYRGLLAYYEYSQDKKVWNALLKAVNNVMLNYPINRSQPFFCGTEYSGGVAHGLTFTDLLDRLHQLTGNPIYAEYAVFLYRNFSENISSEKDAQLQNILNPKYRMYCHAAHSYEHLRPLIVAASYSNDTDLQKALHIYLSRLKLITTPTGGAIGDEWIAGRTADASSTGYEFCSLHELMNSYEKLLQENGNPEVAESIENIFFNAAQGSRNPDHSCIAYLKTDNSFEMLGTKNGEQEAGRKQTRYKYSPAHQDVAVCCVPNAGRITPYFLQYSWFKKQDSVLVAALLCPSVLQTIIGSTPIRIEEVTDYPYQNKFVFKITTGKSLHFQLRIRKPDWADSIVTGEKYRLEKGFIVIDRSFRKKDKIEISFNTEVRVREDINHEKYFSYGALVYAKPIAAEEIKGRTYFPGFDDLMYKPRNMVRYKFLASHHASFRHGKIYADVINSDSLKTERIELLPLGKTILRQASFKLK